MLNTKQYFNQLDAIAVQELENETAAAIQGGAAVTLYEHESYNQKKDGRVKPISSSTRNVGSINDKTTSIKVSSGIWEFYKDENYNGLLFTLKAGESYSKLPKDWNDRISSVKKVG